MSINEFEILEESFLKQLENNCKNIEFNKKLIEDYINGPDSSYIKKFIYDFNTVLLKFKGKKYKIFEKVLMYNSMKIVLEEFRESDILIRACKTVNKKLFEWLFTMKLNYSLQDQTGMTALMHAANNGSLGFVVDKIIKEGNDSINIKDIFGNNALFYSTNKPENLKKLLKSNIDIKHINKNGDNVLLYSCRNDNIRSFEILNKYECFDPRYANHEGKTAAMYLVENGRHNELIDYLSKNKDKISPFDINKSREGLVSTYMISYYERYVGNLCEMEFNNERNYNVIKNFAFILSSLIKFGCDFNIPVDKDGNTPIMIFLMMKDYVSAKYLLDNYKGTIDLSIKNKYGVNASYLSLFLNEDIFERLEFNRRLNKNILSYNALKNTIQNNKTFDTSFKYKKRKEKCDISNDDDNIDSKDDDRVNNNINDDDDSNDNDNNDNENDDIEFYQNINYENKYPSVPKFSGFARQWILEVLYPNVNPSVVYPYKLPPIHPDFA